MQQPLSRYPDGAGTCGTGRAGRVGGSGGRVCRGKALSPEGEEDMIRSDEYLLPLFRDRVRGLSTVASLEPPLKKAPDWSPEVLRREAELIQMFTDLFMIPERRAEIAQQVSYRFWCRQARALRAAWEADQPSGTPVPEVMQCMTFLAGATERLLTAHSAASIRPPSNSGLTRAGWLRR